MGRRKEVPHGSRQADVFTPEPGEILTELGLQTAQHYLEAMGVLARKAQLELVLELGRLQKGHEHQYVSIYQPYEKYGVDGKLIRGVMAQKFMCTRCPHDFEKIVVDSRPTEEAT
jgi:hypothetical protein